MDAIKSGAHIAVLVFPFAAENTFSFARKLVEVVSEVTGKTTLVSGKIPEDFDWPDNVNLYDIGVRLHYVKEKQPRWLSVLLWISRLIKAQFKLASWIFRRRHEVDAILCSLGVYYQIPILTAMFLQKKIIVTCFGNYALRAELNYGSKLLAAFVNTLVRMEYALADVILVESLHLVDENELLLSSESKVRNGALFIKDLSHFSAHSDVQRDRYLVGFIGRLVVEKGIQDYLHAIPLLKERAPDLKYIIIGNGSLDGEVSEMLQEQPWASCVEWIRWVDHQEIPVYLNRLSLLVMPSYTEGLPNLALEAMACRTPLLASRVGGVPDLVMDGETGFLLAERSPDVLASAVLRAIENPNLEAITQRARALIENNYSLEASVQRYREIMTTLSL